MPTEQQYAALNAIGRECNTKLKQVDRSDLPAITEAIKPFIAKAKLIGFSDLDLKHQIGKINKQMIDRRLDGY